MAKRPMIRVSIPRNLYEQTQEFAAVIREGVPEHRKMPDLVIGTLLLEGMGASMRADDKPKRTLKRTARTYAAVYGVTHAARR